MALTFSDDTTDLTVPFQLQSRHNLILLKLLHRLLKRVHSKYSLCDNPLPLQTYFINKETLHMPLLKHGFL